MKPLFILFASVALLNAQVKSQNEPTNAAEAAAKKAAADKIIDERYQAWKAKLPADQQAWETVLEQNLGSFYLPIHKSEKVAGKSNAWDFVQDDPKLPRVLLIGDSISRGYTFDVRKAMAGKANVHRAPENCGPTANGVKKIEIWLGDGKWDVIHFNFGIHDRKTPAADYEQRLEALITRMQQTGAKLIFATTTPVPPDTKDGPEIVTQIAEKNEIALRVMKRNGVAVDDLHAFLAPQLEGIANPQDVHFNAKGYELMGRQVAKSIAAVLSPKATTFVIPPDINGLKTIVQPPGAAKPLKVGIFDGKGAPGEGINNVINVLKTLPQAQVTRIPGEQMGSIDLKQFDVVVFSGGSGSQQSKSIGEAGLKNVREFVRGGGGYCGICAGAYLACSNFSWGLGILNASTVSSKWARGRGFMDMEITADGKPVLGEVSGIFKVRYANGPIIKPGDRADIPPYRPLALFRSEIAENGSPVGVMVNSPAQAVGTFGKGRVFISSPHPENTPGLEHLIPRSILWAAGQDEALK